MGDRHEVTVRGTGTGAGYGPACDNMPHPLPIPAPLHRTAPCATLAETLNRKWLARYGADSMCGNCGKLACLLRDDLIRHGFRGHIASGTVDGFPGNHGWVVCDGQILDPSVNQFGDYPVTNNGLHYNEQRRMEFYR